MQKEKVEPSNDELFQAGDNVVAGKTVDVTVTDEVCFGVEDINQHMTMLEEKNRLLDESTDRIKRLQADFDNFRRRTRQEKEELSGVVTERIVADFLPVVDNLGRALASSNQESNSFLTGVEMIYRQLASVIEGLGVETIQAVGECFDPCRHEAVMRVEDPAQPDGLVVEELQKGYVLRGKVIRPSLVKVVGNC